MFVLLAWLLGTCIDIDRTDPDRHHHYCFEVCPARVGGGNDCPREFISNFFLVPVVPLRFECELEKGRDASVPLIPALIPH